MDSFRVSWDSLDWVSNHEGNRWFLVLRVASTDADVLRQLLRSSNEVARTFRQPQLYEGEFSRTPFHVSIAWSLTGPSAKEGFGIDDLREDLQELGLHVGEIKIKIGNDLTSLALSPDQEAE